MYSCISLLSGIILAVMVSLNGHLSDLYGIYMSALIIRIVGMIFAYLVCKFYKEKIIFRRDIPWWYYLGGVIGVTTTLFQNHVFGKMTITSIVSLGLFGQSLASVIIDYYGLLGMKKNKLNYASAIGMIFAIIGILKMLDNSSLSSIIAVLFSIIAGVTVVISRVINAKLSEVTSVTQGSFINQFAGLPLSIIVLLFSQDHLSSLTLGNISIYLGGILGVIVVMLCNLSAFHISAFKLTMLTFIGQIFTGIVLDIVSHQTYSNISFQGGIIIAFGMFISMILEQLRKMKKE